MGEIEDAARLVLGGAIAFAEDMRSKGIHVGMGMPGHCVTCGEAWPCKSEEQERHAHT